MAKMSKGVTGANVEISRTTDKSVMTFIPLASPTSVGGQLVPFTHRTIQLSPRHPWRRRGVSIRRYTRACTSHSESADPPDSPPSRVDGSSDAHIAPRKSSAIQRRMSSVPTLFRGPEGVLGVVLAAAALLVDFAQTLTRLAMRPSPKVSILKTDLRDVDASISTLQSALDASKAALAETERQLDSTIARASTAEGAITAMDDTRAAIAAARQQANDAQERLTAAREALRASNSQRMDASDAASTSARDCARLERTIAIREAELADVCERLEKARVADTEEANNVRANEQALAEELAQREKELAQALSERDEVQRRSAELKKKAGSLEVEASAAAQALLKTENELRRVRSEVESREKEWKNFERESERVFQQSEETERLRVVVEKMESELKGLQEELQVRDDAVQSVANESDKLRSELAAREAELRELNQLLESAKAAESEPGGDHRKSEMNLEEVKSSMEAQQLSLIAEIAKARVATGDMEDEVVDPLERVKTEVDAESGHLQADMIWANAALKKGTEEKRLRDTAIEEVMQSSEDEDDAAMREIFGFSDENGDEDGEEAEAEDAQSEKLGDENDEDEMNLNDFVWQDGRSGEIGANELMATPWLGTDKVSEEEMRNIVMELNGELSEHDEYVIKEMYRKGEPESVRASGEDHANVIVGDTTSGNEDAQEKSKAKKSKAKQRKSAAKSKRSASDELTAKDGNKADADVSVKSETPKKKRGRAKKKS